MFTIILLFILGLVLLSSLNVGSAADQGTGTTATFGTSSWTNQLLGVSWSGMTREPIETTHLGTAAPAATKFGNRTFIANDLVDPGEVTLSIQQNTGMVLTNSPECLQTAAETVTITVPRTGSETAGTLVGTMFATSYEISFPLEELVTADVGLKVSGNVTVTDAV